MIFFFESLQNVQQLNMVDKAKIDKKIVDAISRPMLRNNKSLGNDGLTSKFYKLFSKKTAPFFIRRF